MFHDLFHSLGDNAGELSAGYFRALLTKESSRLNAAADIWQRKADEREDIPEEAKEQIRSATGK